MSQIWTPGGPGPPPEELVERIHGVIRRFAQAHGVDQPAVEVELAGGALLALESISPEPGYGFVTLVVDPQEDEDPEVLIVPIGAVARIVVSAVAERRGRLGFSLPDQ